MILITGANGHFGKATIESLLKKGIDKNKLVGMVRSAEKGKVLVEQGVAIRIGDYNNYASLQEAFKGVHKLLLVSGTELEHRSKQQTDAVKAAKEAGVKHILYTSAKSRPDVSNSPIQLVLNSHIDTENAIKESGMAYTLLRSNLYMDLLPSFLGEKVLENGIFFPAGDGKVGFTLRADMAEAAANVLMGDEHEYKTYNISNPQSVSFGEIAKLLSEISGKVINHHNSDSKTYIDTLTSAGVPQAYALMLAAFAEAAKQGEFVSGETDLRKMLGREPIAVKQFLGDLYSKFIQS